jgi:hypothetical protein
MQAHDDAFGGEIARMLHERAAGLVGSGDSIGATRQRLKVAHGRRRKVYTATAAFAVAGGVVLAGQLPGSGGRGGNGGAATGTAALAGTGVTSAASLQPASPVPSSQPASPRVPPPPPGPSGWHPGESCGTSEKVINADVAKFDWGVRGSLAGDADLQDSLLARAKALVGGAAAKVAYAGEDATTRVVVVFVNPTINQGCDKGMRAVVFHGPAGTVAGALKAQVGYAAFGPDFGFTWAERNNDGSITELVIDPSSVRTLITGGDLSGRTSPAPGTQPTADGTLVHTYAAGAIAPSEFGFDVPGKPGAGDNFLTVAVTADTAAAFANAIGDAPGQLKKKYPGMALPNYTTPDNSIYELTPTSNADTSKGAEAVYWANFSGTPSSRHAAG